MIRFLVPIVLSFLMAFPSYAITGTTGSIKGVVKDAEKGEPQAGITVIATSPSLIGEQTAITDEKGMYVISDLPPGTYSVTALFQKSKVVQPGIMLNADRTLDINLALSMKEGASEVYTILATAPNVDVASATVGVVLNQDFLRNVPVRARDISSALAAAPTAAPDLYGMSIGGATSPENAYVIDGINVTGPSDGLLDTRLVLDFMDQMEIKEGGYGPEFGRATGGFVNVITKGGSNEFHGSVWGYYRPGFFEAKRRDVANPGSAFLIRNELDYYLSAGFEIGGPIVKDLLWFHVGYSPEIQSVNRTRQYQWQQGVDDGTGIIVPVIGADGQRVFETSGIMNDGTTYNGLTERFNGFQQTHQYTFKVTHLINNNNRHTLGVRGAPSFLTGADFVTGYTLNGDPSSFRSKKDWFGGLLGGVYDYSGKFFSDKLKLNVVLGVHHQQDHTAPYDASSELPRINFVGIENLANLAADQAALPAPCTAANDFDASASTGFLGTGRCPVQNYRKGGLGFIADTSLTRVVEKVGLTTLFDFAGLHQLKYGIDFEQILSILDRYYTGGGSFTNNQTGNGGNGSFTGQSFAVNGVILSANEPLHATTATFNYGAFIGDTWTPISNLVINYGLRYELQNMWGIKDGLNRDTLVSKFLIPDNFAPRAGLIWDFTGKGKGAVRFNYGRFYEAIPLDMNERGFGGESLAITRWHRGTMPTRPVRPSCVDANNNPIPYYQVTDPAAQCVERAGISPVFFGGEDALIMPGLKGQYSDELILGFDWEAFPTWVFGVTGIYRTLGSVIEDMSTDGGNTYLIANPGSFDLSQLNELRNQLATTSDPTERARLQNILNVAPSINTFPTPERKNWSVTFKVDKKMSNNLQFTGTYVLSWVWGNYPGLFSANNGQLDPNITSQFDLPQLILNRDGYLPQDARHRIKLSGFYKANLKDFGICAPFFFTLGLSSTIQSGTPYEFLGRDELYGLDEVFVLPRASGGRTPWTWNVDLSVSAGYSFTDDMTLEIFGQFFNLFNTQGVTAVDNRFTASFVRPLTNANSNPNQLEFATDTSGVPVLVNPNYGNAVAFQAPFSAQLGARLKF